MKNVKKVRRRRLTPSWSLKRPVRRRTATKFNLPEIVSNSVSTLGRGAHFDHPQRGQGAQGSSMFWKPASSCACRLHVRSHDAANRCEVNMHLCLTRCGLRAATTSSSTRSILVHAWIVGPKGIGSRLGRSHAPRIRSRFHKLMMSP